MHIDLITLLPEMTTALEHGVVGRALREKILTLQTWNPREYTTRGDGRVDDKPYGGGPGMLMQFEPIYRTLTAIRAAGNNHNKVIYLSPQGQPITQAAVRDFATQPGLILLAGRYEGIDQRLIDHCVDEEWSAGDFVVSGGELPAMLLIDAVARLLPGVLGDENSALEESFSEGLLEYPQYTRPELIEGLSVPEVLLSGDHAAIRRWRRQESLRRTWQRRPNLVKSSPQWENLSTAERQWLEDEDNDDE